jgi:hypothetical protein
MEKQVIIFDDMEPKKHSVRYNTSNKEAAIDSVYIKRTAIGSTVPVKVKITIEEA